MESDGENTPFPAQMCIPHTHEHVEQLLYSWLRLYLDLLEFGYICFASGPVICFLCPIILGCSLERCGILFVCLHISFMSSGDSDIWSLESSVKDSVAYEVFFYFSNTMKRETGSAKAV